MPSFPSSSIRASIHPNRFRDFLTGIAFAGLLAANLHAGEVVKNNNTSALNTSGAWVEGGIPGSGDIAVWDSTQTVDRTNAIGGNLSFGGIKVTNPGGSLYTLSGTTGFTLTLGSSGIDMSAATANLTIGAVMDLSASQTWTVASGRTLAVNGANTGSGTLSLAGSGTFTFGNNSALGAGTVNLGNGITLAKGVGGVLTLANHLKLNGDITLSNTNNVNGFTLSGDLDVGAGNRTLALRTDGVGGGASNAAFIFTGGADGAPKITGTGSLILENANTGGTPARVIVDLGTSGDSGFTRVDADLVIGDNVQVQAFRSGSFSASSDVTVAAGGILSLAKGNSVSNQTVGSLSGAGLVTKGATVTNSNSALLTIDGGTRTISADFSGVVQNGTGTGVLGITKTGATTQVFSGANTYTGKTTVTAGTLLVNGTHVEAATAGNGFGSATDGRYLVQAGATLGGKGRIGIALGANANANNAILVQAGGIVAPGAGIGTLTLDAADFTRSGGNDVYLNMASDAKFAFELAGNGGAADKIAFWNYVNGDLGLNGNAINLTLVGPVVAGEYVVTLFEFYSDGGGTLTNSGITSGLTLGTLGGNIAAAEILYNLGGNRIQLSYTVVPEPSTGGLVFLGLAFLLRRRRRAAGI